MTRRTALAALIRAPVAAKAKAKPPLLLVVAVGHEVLAALEVATVFHEFGEEFGVEPEIVERRVYLPNGTIRRFAPDDYFEILDFVTTSAPPAPTN